MPSGIDEDTAVSERLVDQRAWNIAPLVDVAGADDNDVEGNFKTAQLTTQASRLGSALRDLARLNDEQVEVAVRAGLAAGARAEEDLPALRVPPWPVAYRPPLSTSRSS